MEIRIEHAEQADGGAFFIEREGLRLAEMVYTRTGPARIIIAHTEVHERLQGHGVARKLLDALVAWARDTKTRVLATCPYAKAQFAKDPSIADVYEG
ncbi:MAG TPA: GNAT family N-acetyltransferase [Polyangiales bacterium]